MSRRTWTILSGACLLAALVILAFSELLVLDANPLIHVRWRASVDARARAALERQFNLQPVQEIPPNGWRYELADSSTETIRRLVTHADVDDTHYIDRNTFRVVDDGPLGARRPGPVGERWPAMAYGLVDYGPVALLSLAAIAALCAAAPRVASAAVGRALSLITRGIPPLSPRGLAIFRLVFGLALVSYIWLHLYPAEPFPREVHQIDAALADMAPIHWLAERPALVRGGQWLAILCAALFAIGILPRLFYAVAVAGTVQWLLALALRADTHPFGVLVFPLICLIAVPWSDAPPLHRLLGRDPAPGGLPDKRYGYAPWLLSFALGVAFAGAAWAKLREGPGWILNGTVRYHFVTDFSQAHVDWGLAIATMPRVAILFSATGVLIEALTIAAAFARMPILRLMMGFAAASLLTGFYLFQGILWPAWWMLLLGFLPWQWLDASPGVSGRAWISDVSRGQIFCILGLSLQQIVISAAFIEFGPVGSRYDMYSKSHASPQDFERENPGVERRILTVDDRGGTTDLTECAAHLKEPVLAALRTFDTAASQASTLPLKMCHPEGSVPRRYLLLEDRCLFDWNAGHFYCVYRDKLVGTLPVVE